MQLLIKGWKCVSGRSRPESLLGLSIVVQSKLEQVSHCKPLNARTCCIWFTTSCSQLKKVNKGKRMQRVAPWRSSCLVLKHAGTGFCDFTCCKQGRQCVGCGGEEDTREAQDTFLKARIHRMSERPILCYKNNQLRFILPLHWLPWATF